MLVLYAMALFLALYHGFIPWLYSGLYTGFHVAGVPGRPLRAETVQGARYSADSLNLDVLLVMLFRMPLAN